MASSTVEGAFTELIQMHINKGFPEARYEHGDTVDVCRLCGEESTGRDLRVIQGDWIKCFPKFDPAINPNKYGIAMVPICDKCNELYNFDALPTEGVVIAVMGYPLHVDSVNQFNK